MIVGVLTGATACLILAGFTAYLVLLLAWYLYLTKENDDE